MTERRKRNFIGLILGNAFLISILFFPAPAKADPCSIECFIFGRRDCADFASCKEAQTKYDTFLASEKEKCVLNQVTCAVSAAGDKTFGMKTVAETAGLTKSTVSKTIPGLVGNVVSVGMALVGVLFFILILYGGLIWMTAAGNTEKSEKAKSILIAATVGLIIVLSAYAITRFIFNAAGTDGEGDRCSQQYPKSGVCGPKSQCDPKTMKTVTGLCPGTADVVCCYDPAAEAEQQQ